MTYWACARLELRRDAVAQHFLKLNGYETCIPVSYTHLTLPTNREV